MAGLHWKKCREDSGDTTLRIYKNKFLDIKALSKEQYKINTLAKDFCILLYKKRKYLVKRIGECDYKKCGCACCRFLYFSNTDNKFLDGFLKRDFNGHVLKKRCKNLLSSGKCKLWGKKGFPGACKDYPNLSDDHYLHIHNKCLFKFKVIGEIV